MKIFKTANYKKIAEDYNRNNSNLEEELIKKALDLIFEKKLDVSQAFRAVFSQDDLFNGTVTKLYNRVKQDPRYLNRTN